VSNDTANLLGFAISFLAAVSSACLYVPAVRYGAWAAVWTFGLTLFVFGIAAVVMFARVLWR
jgi:hypothetical protein